MASLDQVVDVKINLNTFSIAKANFGIPIAISPFGAIPLAPPEQRILKYYSYDEAASDYKIGAIDTATLKAVQTTFSQTPRPNQCWVGRRLVSHVTLRLVYDGVIPVGTIFGITLNGQAVSVTSIGSDTLDTLRTKLFNAIDSASITGITATDAGAAGGIQIGVDNDAATFTIGSAKNTTYEMRGDHSEIGVSGDLSNINLEDNGWYGFMMVERPDDATQNTLITGAAAWAEAQTKLYFACCGQGDITTTVDTDILSTLQKKQYLRTAFVWHDVAGEYPEAAWMGRCFTMDPGSETWALKNLPGITPVKLNATQRQNVYKKNGNLYDQIALNTYLIGAASDGLQAQGGKVVSGEWIDVVRFRDWLTDYIQKSMSSLMIRQKKVPYTNGGIALLVNSLRASLRQGQIVGGIAPDEVDSEGNTVPGFIIQYPNAADVPFDQKAQRVLNMSFTALLAGAIQLVKINGNLTYTYSGS